MGTHCVLKPLGKRSTSLVKTLQIPIVLASVAMVLLHCHTVHFVLYTQPSVTGSNSAIQMPRRSPPAYGFEGSESPLFIFSTFLF